MGLFKSHGKHASDTAKQDEQAVASEEENEIKNGAEDSTDNGEDALPNADEREADAADAIDSLFEEEPTVEPIEEDSSSYVATKFDEVPAEKRRGGLKAIGITCGVIIGLVAIAYVVGAFVFMGRFLPNTVVGGYDVSMKTDSEVAQMLDQLVADYQLDVIGNGFSYRTTGKAVGMSLDADSIVKTMHQRQNSWQWPVLIVQPKHDESDVLTVTYDASLYEGDVTKAVEAFNATATPPANATIVFDQKTDKFLVQPEKLGTQLDTKAVLKAMANSIGRLDYKLNLTDADLIQPTVFSTDEKLHQAAELATGMTSAKLTLIMGGQKVAEVNGESLSQFITMNENYEVVLEEEAMDQWVADLAMDFDTVGTERTFTREDGKECVVPAGGVYGWEVDSLALEDAIIEGIKEGKTAEIEVPCVKEAAVFNGKGQRDWGKRYIDVDLDEQHVRMYGDDGSVIWESDCISGTPDGTHNTVPGSWYINNKESPSKLIGYENGKKIYETTVTFWMAFEYNGIGLHDATWQPSFGGSMYANGYGSHGCVNLPYDAAEELYDITEVGDPVIVHF